MRRMNAIVTAILGGGCLAGTAPALAASDKPAKPAATRPAKSAAHTDGKTANPAAASTPDAASLLKSKDPAAR